MRTVFFLVFFRVTDHYILRQSFLNTLSPPSLYTDFLETLPHDVGSTATENMSSKFSYVPLKEIRGQKPHFGYFSETASRY